MALSWIYVGHTTATTTKVAVYCTAADSVRVRLTSASATVLFSTSVVAIDSGYGDGIFVAMCTVSELVANTEYTLAAEINGTIDTTQPGRVKSFPVQGQPCGEVKIGLMSCHETLSNVTAFLHLRDMNCLWVEHMGDRYYRDYKVNDPLLARLAMHYAPANPQALYRNQCMSWILSDHEVGGGPGLNSSPVTKSRAANVATLTTGSAHGMLVGEHVSVSMTFDTSFWVIDVPITAVPSTTSFSYANPGPDVAQTSCAGRLYGAGGGVNGADRFDPHIPAVNLAYRQMIPSAPLPAGTGLYYMFWAGRIPVIHTDTRCFRDPNFFPESAAHMAFWPKTLLGAVQLQWFKDQLTAAKLAGAPMILWVQESLWDGLPPAGTGDQTDTWSGFNTERKELSAWMRDQDLPPIVVCEGDLHSMAGKRRALAYTTEGISPVRMVAHASMLDKNSPTGGGYNWDFGPLVDTSKNYFETLTIVDDGTSGQVSLQLNGWETTTSTGALALSATVSDSYPAPLVTPVTRRIPALAGRLRPTNPSVPPTTGLVTATVTETV